MSNDLSSGPQPGVSYPLKIIYCGGSFFLNFKSHFFTVPLIIFLECSLPYEYCENGPTAEKCKEWMKKNLPDLFSQLNPPSADGSSEIAESSFFPLFQLNFLVATDGASGEEKKPQKRGGKGLPKAVKKEAVDKKITLSRAPRGKNKFVTVVGGLSSYGKLSN